MPFRLAYMTDLIYLLFGAAPSQIPTNSLSGNALAIANSLNQNGSPSTISFFYRSKWKFLAKCTE